MMHVISQIKKIPQNLPIRFLLVLIQKACHVFSHENLWLNPLNRFDHGPIQSASGSVDNSTSVSIDADVLTRKSADNYVSIFGYGIHQFPNVTRRDFSPDIVLIRFT